MFNQDKKFTLKTGGGNITNYGNMNSDLSTNVNYNNMFNATAGGSSNNPSTYFLDQIDNALDFGAAGQAGLIPANGAGVSSVTGDYSSLIPNPTNIIQGANGMVEANIGATRALGDLYMQNMFGPRWPMFGYGE